MDKVTIDLGRVARPLLPNIGQKLNYKIPDHLKKKKKKSQNRTLDQDIITMNIIFHKLGQHFLLVCGEKSEDVALPPFSSINE